MIPDEKDLIPITKAYLLLGVGKSAKTVNRWRLQGCVSKQTGERVFLRTIQIGGSVYTTREFYEQFVAALNGDFDQEEE